MRLPILATHAVAFSRLLEWVANSRKVARAFLALGLWLACGLAAARAQSALDGFDPKANGPITAIVVQADGKILIGGGFTLLAPNGGPFVTRNRIARLNADGTLDTTFDPNANSNVTAIALQADGKILVGGFFSGAGSIGGAARNRIARLDPVTGLADSFDPSANADVTAIAVQTDGKILVGGNFSGANSIGGQARNRLARLDPITGLADSFNPNANAGVLSVVVQANGRILVGGAFFGANSIGGQARNRIARLDPVTGLADSFNPGADNNVRALAVQPDGRILVAGEFFNCGGQPRNRIARLDAFTGAADSFNPNANNIVWTVVVQPDGRILAGGNFNGANSIGGQARNRLARLDPATGAADSFNPNANNSVLSIAMQPDGKILAGGQFTGASSMGGATRDFIARLESDGSLDRTLDASIVGGSVVATAVQPDGKILLGGFFSSVLGVTRNNIARLNVDGTLDLAFDPNANNQVSALAVQADGKILVGGNFNGANSVGGAPRNFLARLDPTTGLADSLNPNPNGGVTSVVVQADGKILVGGGFNGANSIGGQARNRLARLDPMTGLADSFNPGADNNVRAIALQTDGKVVAAGEFTNIGGQPRNRLARLDAVTGAADSFNPSANGTVWATAVQTDGKILAGGAFNGANSIGGQMRNRIARLDPATGAADSFNPNANDTVFSIALQANGSILAAGNFTGANSIGGALRNFIARLDPVTGAADSFNPNATGQVLALALQADGKILAGGGFPAIGGQTRNRFARLTNNTAALQNLTVSQQSPTFPSQSTVTWTRGGSSPQLTGVIFESSPDNVNYTPLGNATPAGSNWTLPNLFFPWGQNFYVRARGSYLAGSESLTESVRNVFIVGPPVPIAVVSRKTHGAAGNFDINLPFTGGPGVECRSGGATNDHSVVLTFSEAVTFSAISFNGVGSISGTSGGGTTTITVNLTGVTNAQTIGIVLFGVSNGMSSLDIVVPMGVLIGDSNGDGTVNAGDAVQTRGRSGQTSDGTNFRSDVNADGFVNSGDTLVVRSRSGASLP